MKKFILLVLAFCLFAPSVYARCLKYRRICRIYTRRIYVTRRYCRYIHSGYRIRRICTIYHVPVIRRYYRCRLVCVRYS